MIETVEDLELLDPSLSSERLVYRLFHERGVRVFKSVPIVAQCSCSRDGVEAMLRSFSQDDRDHMVENGKISVTCEFCSANYQFAPDDVRPEAGGESGEAKPAIMSASARRMAAVIAVVAVATAHSVAAARAQSCPAPLADAKRLVLVTAPTMNDMAATMRLYERASANEAWRALGAAEPATIGRAGMGWSQFFPSLLAAANRSRSKATSGRRPASIRSAGASASWRRRGRTISTSRPTRSASMILRRRPTTPSPRALALGPAVRAENMSRVLPMYRRGLLVDYPTDARKTSRVVHLHPRLALADDRHRRLRRDARAAGRGVAGFRRRRRRAGDPAARRAGSAAGLPSQRLERGLRWSSSGKRCSKNIAPVEAGSQNPG